MSANVTRMNERKHVLLAILLRALRFFLFFLNFIYKLRNWRIEVSPRSARTAMHAARNFLLPLREWSVNVNLRVMERAISVIVPAWVESNAFTRSPTSMIAFGAEKKKMLFTGQTASKSSKLKKRVEKQKTLYFHWQNALVFARRMSQKVALIGLVQNEDKKICGRI